MIAFRERWSHTAGIGRAAVLSAAVLGLLTAGSVDLAAEPRGPQSLQQRVGAASRSFRGGSTMQSRGGSLGGRSSSSRSFGSLGGRSSSNRSFGSRQTSRSISGTQTPLGGRQTIHQQFSNPSQSRLATPPTRSFQSNQWPRRTVDPTPIKHSDPLPPLRSTRVGTSIGRSLPGNFRPQVMPKLERPSTIKITSAGKGEPALGRPAREALTGRGFRERFEAGDLKRVTSGQVAAKLNLAEQYRMRQEGDVARRLSLHKPGGGLPKIGDVVNAAKIHPTHALGGHDYGHLAHRGRISPLYKEHSFAFHYYGPWQYPAYCWYPRWTPWVHWSWYYHCPPVFDPRPIWCRPVVYTPAPAWSYWHCPPWAALPVVTCGTWVNVEPVAVGDRHDLQLLAVRFVDPGHPEESHGPRFRVWFRNNGQEPITRPFNVLLIASRDADLTTADLPQAGVRVTNVDAGQTQSVDVRLPIAVYEMGRDEQGRPLPFSTLHVLVDADREVPEAFESNNGARLGRADVLPVDPAAFGVEPSGSPAGSEVLLAGEGFGPEPGRVLVNLGGMELDGEIVGWYDLGVRLTLPNLPLAAPTQAELIVVRADGAAANPLSITVQPPQVGFEAIPRPPALPP